MTERADALVTYRLQRAREALDEGRLMAEYGHTNTAVSRLYYACFYAVSALLYSRGLSSAKHSGVRSLFGQHLVKTGLVSTDLAALYNDLFEYRQESDYEDFYRIDPQMLQPWLAQAQRFVDTIAELIASSE